MLNKKFMMVTIILISLFAVSTVSAADNATGDVVSVEETIGEIVCVEENQTIGQNYDEEIIGVDDGTFTDLKSKVGNLMMVQITLDRNYVYDYSYDYRLGDDGISIDKSFLIIDGNGHTIDAGGQSRIFNIKFGSKVILQNINFVNAYSSGDGGAIYVHDLDFEIENCTFTNNFAEGSGGAIYASMSLLKISDSIFTNNGATGVGGAVYGMGTTIDNSTFTGNYILSPAPSSAQDNVTAARIFNVHTENKGGAIYNNGTLTVTDSLFENNFAEGGGAIYNYEGSLDLTDSVLKNNDAFVGGAICGFNSTLTVTDSGFVENTAGMGGAICGIEGTSAIIESSFENNRADEGGAFYGLTDILTVTGSTFVENYARDGSAIYGNSIESLVVDSTFSDNIAEGSGSIFTKNGSLEVSDSLFTKNNGKYGAISNLYGDLTVSRSNFRDNKGIYGAAIYNQEGALNVTDSQFANNTALDGGAISNYGFECTVDPYENGTLGEEYVQFDAAISNCTFRDNAADAGGAIFNNLGGLKITKSIFDNNQAVQAGGAVYNNDYLIVISTVLSNNQAAKAGGAVYNKDYLIVLSTALSNNQAVQFGGALDNRGKLRIEKSDLTHNMACCGGAVYNLGKSTVIDTNFTDNIVKDSERSYGGAVFTKNNRVVQKAGDYNSTEADPNDFDFKIDGAVFKNNTADVGGAVFVIDSLTLISNSLFVENEAQLGSVACVNHTSMLRFGENISFIDNSNNAKCIFSNSGYDFSNFKVLTTISFEICHIDDMIKGSPATIKLVAHTKKDNITGKVILKIGDKSYIVTLNNSTGVLGPQVFDLATGKYVASIDFNQSYFTPASAQSNEFKVIAKNSFSALANEISKADGSITLNEDYVYDPNTDSQFKDGIVIDRNLTINANGKSINANNSARIFKVTGNATVTIKDATLINGNAKNGGAILVDGATLTVENSVLKDNQAKSGGAIANNGNLTIVNSKLVNNTATDNGGAISNTGPLSIVESELTSNQADEGGAIDNSKGSVEIVDSKLKDNTAQNAGAISTDDGESVSISNTKFVDNGGDAISSDSGEVNISESKFVSEVAFKIDYITDSISGSDIVVNVSETTKGSQFSGNVTLHVGGYEYVVEIINGTGSMVITPDLTSGNYDVKLNFNGTDAYDSADAVSNSFTVAAKPTAISSDAVTTVYNGGKYLYATLKDSSGKAINGAEITVRLSNGKTFNQKTDKNGKIKVPTDNLAPNKYNAVIIFNGNGKYVKSNATAKIIVKKATPKLTAKAKAFKRTDKTKKYTVTLKTNRNKVMKNTKVTLKVKGKTYTAKTNIKGVATFKLTKLTKKGKFTATVKYAGSKYYNAKTVKPKITVK